MSNIELRDYLAGQAMKYMGLPVRVHYGSEGNDRWTLKQSESEEFPYEQMARVAYKWADAMIKVREEKE